MSDTNKTQTEYLDALLASFGPDEGAKFNQFTWAKIHAAVSSLRAEVERVKGALEGEVANCPDCSGTGEYENINDQMIVCNRCLPARAALHPTGDKQVGDAGYVLNEGKGKP